MVLRLMKEGYALEHLTTPRGNFVESQSTRCSSRHRLVLGFINYIFQIGAIKPVPLNRTGSGV